MTGSIPLRVTDPTGRVHLRTRVQWERLDKPRGWTLTDHVPAGQDDETPKPKRTRKASSTTED